MIWMEFWCEYILELNVGGVCMVCAGGFGGFEEECVREGSLRNAN